MTHRVHPSDVHPHLALSDGESIPPSMYRVPRDLIRVPRETGIPGKQKWLWIIHGKVMEHEELAKCHGVV